MAKGLTLLSVGKGRFEGALCDSSSLGGDADAAAVQRGKCDFVTLAFISDAIADGYFTVRERKLRASSSVNAELLFLFSNGETVRPLFDHQGGDSLFAFFRLGVDVYDRGIGDAAIGDPRFRAIDYVGLTFAGRLGRQSSGV